MSTLKTSVQLFIVGLVALLFFCTLPFTAFATSSADEYIAQANARRTELGRPQLTQTEQLSITTATNNFSAAEWQYIDAANTVRVNNKADLLSGPEIGRQISSFRNTPVTEQPRLLEEKVIEAQNVRTGADNNPISCEGSLNLLSNPGTCIFRAFAAGLGSVLITLTAYLLEVVGLLFNWLVHYTVIAFGDSTNGFLTEKVLKSIDSTWTVFRDIANILIIGLFVFIAISIILGLQEFGQKKMIARVLVIAVLMNFSLLFTKMIIDGSNFFAYQFYRSASGLEVGSASGIGSASATQTSAALSFTQDGIAGKFIRFMGVTSLSNVFDTLRKSADKADSGWIALLHGVFSATLLLGVAIVLFYGCFLLTARAVLLVFLLITSSLAFASYLVPQLSSGSMGEKFGWAAWWSALIKAALFGPMLLMFLWATLAIAEALRPANGTLGGLMTNPADGGNLSALFSYVIILGFLYASLKVSSSLSAQIGGGFNMATTLAKFSGIAPVLGIAGFAGAGLRSGIGGRAARQSRDAEKQIAHEMSIASNPDLDAFVRKQAKDRAENLTKKKMSLDKTASREFNVLGSTLTGALNKQIGLAALKEKGGYKGRSDEVTKEAMKAVADATVSRDDAQKHAQRIAGDEVKPERDSFEAQQKASEALVESARAAAATEQKTSSHARDLDTHVQAANTASQQKTVIEKSSRLSETERAQQMRAEDEKIKTANAGIQRAHAGLKEIENRHLTDPLVEAAKQRAQEAKNAVGRIDAKVKDRVKEITGQIVSAGIENAAAVVSKSVHADSYTHESIAKGLRKKISNKRLVDQARAIREETGEDGATPPATT